MTEMTILRGREKGDEYEREQLFQPSAAEKSTRDSARRRDAMKEIEMKE